jgi:hypothetical protein
MFNPEELKIEDFEYLIKSFSNDEYLQLYLTREDIEQHLAEKIIKKFPKIKECSDNREDCFSYTKVMLKNEIVSIKRHYYAREHHSKNALSWNELEDDIDNYHYHNKSYTNQVNSNISLLAGELLTKIESPIDITLYNQLKKLIFKWLEGQDEVTKKFIIESINPSNDILDKYEESIKDYKKTPHQIYIPPHNRAQLLGISRKKLWKILGELTEFLTLNGFKI